jgi:hypothetical protein
MELPPHEGGINELTFELSKGNSQTFFLQNTKNMQKLHRTLFAPTFSTRPFLVDGRPLPSHRTLFAPTFSTRPFLVDGRPLFV